MRNRWLWAALVAVLGVVVVDAARDGSTGFAAGYGALVLALAWWTSPWRGRRGPTHVEVLTMDETDPRKDVVIYWRPGCGYCALLRARLGALGDRASWVNIWQDEEAAAFVRSVNHGNETVPTVVVDGEPMTNPDPRLVVERLSAQHG
jgi:mycoredoxin